MKDGEGSERSSHWSTMIFSIVYNKRKEDRKVEGERESVCDNGMG